MSSKSSGPRFNIGSTKPTAATSVLDELIGKVPTQAAPVASEGEITGTVVPAPAVAKFGNELEPPTLEECEQHIRTVTTQWLIGVGRALRAIRDHELYSQAGFDSFGSYLRHRLDMGAPQATRLIQAVPVVEALEGRTDREIKEGQARVLVPVLKHGEHAVREVWDAAARSGYPSAKALERAARDKGYLDAQPEDEEPAAPPAPPEKPAVWKRFEPVLPVVRDLRALADLTREAPERSMELAFDLARAFEEIKDDLPDELRAKLEKAVLEGTPPHSL
ncbi:MULTISPECIES: hypothetical protein [unclassified Nonomuraea]|uniref:hypothetical protein n=1 Tax=unclassified Nonomuraea TaxID=2593643 RepID=UPI0033E7D226